MSMQRRPMDPPSQPNSNITSPQAHAHDAESLPTTQDVLAVEIAQDANKTTARKMQSWVTLVAVVLALALLGAGTWWYMAHGTGGPSTTSGQSGVPKDAVALINSSTALPTAVAPTGPKDPPGDLTYAPDSAGWSDALREAHRAQDEGRYSAAISQYAALVGSSSAGEARDALWGLASAYWQAGQGDLAIRTYTLLSGLDDPRVPRAYAHMAQIYEQTDRGPEAVPAYNDYLKRAGPALHAIMLMKARLMGASAEAEAVYKAILDDKPSDIDTRDALTAWADMKSRRGDHKGAGDLYSRLAVLQHSAPRPLLDNYGAPAAVFAADEARAAGDVDGAKQRLLSYLKGECGGKGKACAPYSYGLYTALNSLLKIEPSAVVSGTISPMQAAHIAYDAGYFSKAIGYMDTLRQQSPASPDLAEASLLTGKAFESSGDDATAYTWYTNTVQTYPAAPQAPEAGRRAGDAMRNQSHWDEAMAAYKLAIERYPDAGEKTVQARINGGVLAYRLEQQDVALNLLQPVLSAGAISPTLKAEAGFWVGKLQRSAGNPAWKSALAPVSTLEPGSFLDFRARSLLNGEADGGPIVPPLADSGVAADKLGVQYESEAAERSALLQWAAGLSGGNSGGTAGVATPAATGTTSSTAITNTAASGIQAPLKDDAELQRAVSLLNMGFEVEAYRSFRVLGERLQNTGDVAALAQLLLYLRYHASTYTAMRVSELLGAMDKAGDPTKRPSLFLKTLYPTPYTELVMEAATKRDIDPLVMYALMKQESQFKPDARSGADARGLAQVIPSTGAGIAQQLGDSNFSANDLYLPYIAIRYGAYYLASNLPQFDSKLLPVLAAYNGGPGNADRWLAGSALIDPDLYTERIDLFETEDYLRKVYQNYGFYRLTYMK